MLLEVLQGLSGCSRRLVLLVPPGRCSATSTRPSARPSITPYTSTAGSDVAEPGWPPAWRPSSSAAARCCDWSLRTLGPVGLAGLARWRLAGRRGEGRKGRGRGDRRPPYRLRPPQKQQSESKQLLQAAAPWRHPPHSSRLYRAFGCRVAIAMVIATCSSSAQPDRRWPLVTPGWGGAAKAIPPGDSHCPFAG